MQPVAVGELSAELCCWQVSTPWSLLAGAVLSLLLFPLPCSARVLPPTVPWSGSQNVQTCGCSSCKDGTSGTDVGHESPETPQFVLSLGALDLLGPCLGEVLDLAVLISLLFRSSLQTRKHQFLP